MNDTHSSIQPEAGMPLIEPGAIKVFGILHLVFGGIGVFGFLFTVAQLFFKEAIMKASAAGDPQMYEFQKSINDASLVPTILGLVIGLVVTVMILRAGLKLVKKKKDAVQASILYSYVSIGAKLLGIVLALTLTLPAINGALDGMSATGGASPQAEMMVSTMKVSMAVSSIAMPVILCVYPILSMVMLKRKPIVSFLEEHGK